MRQETIDRLRAVFRSGDEAWDIRMNELLSEIGSDVETLARVRVFLSGKLGGAAPEHVPRMRDMIAAVDRRSKGLPVSDSTLEGLAAGIEDASRRLADLEEKLREERDVVAALLGPEARRLSGPFRIQVGKPGLSLSTLDPGLVPDDFMTRQPDRKRILEHFAGTGEILPGVEIKERRAPVTVRRVQEEGF